MKQLVVLGLLSFSLIAVNSAFADWQIGGIAGGEYDAETQTAAPILLPWLSYQTEHWQLDPTKVQFQQPLAWGQWRAGLAVDHGAWQQGWRSALAANTGLAGFVGPVRVDNTIQQSFDGDWLTRHTLAMQVPVAKRWLLGVETGLLFEGDGTFTEADASWLVGAQALTAIEQWRFMAMANWQQQIAQPERKLTTLVMAAYQW